MNVNALAYCDTLQIIELLQEELDDAGIAEVHIFAYLACLLSLYEGWPASQWGYSFLGQENAQPYSPDVNDALNSMLEKGSTVRNREDQDFVRLTDTGKHQLSLVRALKQNASRYRFVAGACESVYLTPIGLVRSAIREEPDLRRAYASSKSHRLLEGTGVSLLHDHFEGLRKVLEKNVDPILVSVLWLQYLAQNQSAYGVEIGRL